MRITQENFDLTLKVVKYNMFYYTPKFCLTTPRFLYYQSGHRAIDTSNVYAKLLCMSKGCSRMNALYILSFVDSLKKYLKTTHKQMLKKLFSTKLKFQTREALRIRTTEQILVEK